MKIVKKRHFEYNPVDLGKASTSKGFIILKIFDLFEANITKYLCIVQLIWSNFNFEFTRFSRYGPYGLPVLNQYHSE